MDAVEAECGLDVMARCVSRMGTSAAEGLTSEHSGGFLLSRRSKFRNVLQRIIEVTE